MGHVNRRYQKKATTGFSVRYEPKPKKDMTIEYDRIKPPFNTRGKKKFIAKKTRSIRCVYCTVRAAFSKHKLD